MAKASKKSLTEKVSASGSLRDRLLQNTTVKETNTLDKSEFFKPKDYIRTRVPMINVALQGDFDGGLIPGVLMLAGPSKHFKTGFALLLVKAFLDKYEDGMVIFYDSEFGSPQSYFQANKIPLDRVIHTPITDIEKLKHDIMTQFAHLSNTDHVMVVIDSMGNMASVKEIADALEGESKADFTRAKEFKSLFRMITPHLTLKSIPVVAINHSYKTIEKYSKDVVGGGTGAIYGANDIWILGREQQTEGEGAEKELLGWNFKIRIEKSRFVKEKSVIPISVTFANGIMKWSGLFELALELGIIEKGKPGWYKLAADADNDAVAGFRRKDVENDGAFWAKVIKDTNFRELVKETYLLPKTSMVDEEEIDLETGEVL